MEGGAALRLARLVLALLVPPYSVYRMRGLGPSFWLNVALTIFGYVLGSVHATVVFLEASPEERRRTT